MESVARILQILDSAAESCFFPALDNGYTYLAATRLALFHSSSDWAMVIETFGFSPRAGHPDLAIHTFASQLRERNQARNYVSDDAYRNYLRVHPHDDSRVFWPVEQGAWIEEELVVEEPGTEVVLRGRPMPIPMRTSYAQFGIRLEDEARTHVFELCRYLAAVAREDVLATVAEQRVSVLPEMEKVLQLDEWHHPDLTSGERPSGVASFRQLASVLASGDASKYQPTAPPNTHWKHWPVGGTL